MTGQNRSSAVMQQRSEPHEIVSIAEAKARGLRWYFTGIPCVNGHIAKRSLSNRGCRACVEMRRAAKDQANPARARERNVRRYHKDVTASREKVRLARERHAEKRRAYDRERYADPDRKAAQKQQALRWARENPGKRNAIVAARRSWIKRATPRWLTQEDRRAIAVIYRKAASYGPGVMEVDHIVPLRGRNVCGLHVPGNLRIIPAQVNRLKSNLFSEALA
ncbi:hypothetical protein [Novosphingobium sp.]|uniref:hypothetical protein n=1 Tax=Novosphingobium sp. TaxID=1874826 RepID=UPI00262974AB|nr:hypothetical protein [Novosphingobium sp.]